MVVCGTVKGHNGESVLIWSVGCQGVNGTGAFQEEEMTM